MATCFSPCVQHFVVSVQVTAQATFNPLFSYAQPLFGYVTILAITVADTATGSVWLNDAIVNLSTATSTNKRARAERRAPQCIARWISLLRSECGSGLVEYAIVFTIFMTMLLGIADFGRAMYAYHFVSSAARDATRWAAVNGANCAQDASCTFANGAQAQDVENFVTQHVPLGINSAQLVVHPDAIFLKWCSLT